VDTRVQEGEGVQMVAGARVAAEGEMEMGAVAGNSEVGASTATAAACSVALAARVVAMVTEAAWVEALASRGIGWPGPAPLHRFSSSRLSKRRVRVRSETLASPTREQGS